MIMVYSKMWELLPSQLILAVHLHCAVVVFPFHKGSRITGRGSEGGDKGDQKSVIASVQGMSR